MSSKSIFNYAKQLSTALGAGLPINRALETLARTAPTKRLRAVSAEMNRSIASGSSLAEAFEKNSPPFPDFFTRTIEVGERTGRLEEVTRSLSSYYEQRYAIAISVKSELYPIVVYLGIAMGLILFIQWLLGGAAALQGHAEALAWAALAVTAVWAGYNLSEGFRRAIGGFAFHLPLVGRLMRKLSLSRFCEGMQLALEAGLDIVEAIRLSSGSSGNAAFQKRAMRTVKHLEKGASISEALEKTGVFPFQAMQILVVGEETGKLHEAMGHVSKLTREEAIESLRLTLRMGIRLLYTLAVLYIAYKVVLFWGRIYRGIGGL